MMDNLDLFLLLYLIAECGNVNLVNSKSFDKEFDEMVNNFERVEPDILKIKFVTFVKSQKEKFRELNEIRNQKGEGGVEE